MRDLDRLVADQAAALLHEWPLNPTQHLWRVLATKFAFPFVKTELVLRNPGRLPGVREWPRWCRKSPVPATDYGRIGNMTAV